MQNSLVNILTEARDSLTLETWRKGRYFQSENKTICMCAHGAVQRIVNPKVKLYLDKLDISGATAETGAAPVALAEVATTTSTNNVKNNPHKSLLQIWNDRPNWVKGDKYAHYLLGMVGLTIGFNDHSKTTLDMIKEKFNQAIELAKLIENQNNG